MNISPAIPQAYPLGYSGSPRSIVRAASPEEVQEAASPVQDPGAAGSPSPAIQQQSDRVSPSENPEDSQAQTKSETQADSTQLTEEELKLVEELKAADQEVRQHEMAHMAAGGSLVTSGAQYSFKTGPDGQQYAVAGEVGIDTSPVPGDPQATIDKMNQVKQAALAPASPSGQDIRVAAAATAKAAEAAGELTQLLTKQQASQDDTRALGAVRQQAADTYAKVNSLPESDTHTFQLAV